MLFSKISESMTAIFSCSLEAYKTIYDGRSKGRSTSLEEGCLTETGE